MQNKGLVRLFAVLFTLVCIFYLSFSVVTNYYNKKASEYAKGDKMKEYIYLDSLANKKIWWLGGYTLKECREKEINLGLDLKGGMNVTLEVSVADVIRSLADHNPNPIFNQALAKATELEKTNSNANYVDLFVSEYKKLDPQAKLATIFSTYELKDRISLTTSNDEVIKILKTEVEGAISNSFNVLRQRIDRFGVVQPNIQKQGNGRILVELPGIKEPVRVRKLLQGSANLEFWETYEFSEIANYFVEANKVLAKTQNQGAKAASGDTTAIAADAKTAAPSAKKLSGIDSLKAAVQKKGTTPVAANDSAKMIEKNRKENPLYAVLQLAIYNGQVGNGPVIGIAAAKDTATVNAMLANKQVRELMPRDLGLRWSVKSISDKQELFQLIAIKITNRDGHAPLSGEVITDARADFSQASAYANVSMSMNAEGSKVWSRLTQDNVGKCIAISLDGYIYSFPRVNTKIDGGSSQITGNFTVEEAKDLANTLKSGKMPAPAHIVQEDIVGPSLGQEAINNGLISFVIAFVLVLIYMIVYYGVIPGLVADIALFANVFFLMGILASFQSVLTLPGIAGIVLTMGMAVDANVLIYERIREEMRHGKNMRAAIKEGFKHALNAIVDSNVTTLLTGIVLVIFGQGPIKGFGVTLSWGIVTTFATAVFLTRYMIEGYAARETAKEIPFQTKLSESFLLNTKINFMGIRKSMYILSAAMFIISFVSMATRSFDFGIDFTGGRNYKVAFDQTVKPEDVKGLLKDAFGKDAPQVITIGSDNQVRISTKYKINENGQEIDNEIESMLYQNLKPLLKKSVSEAQFKADYIKSSSKVGPTVADDIKTSAIWAVLIAILGIGLYILLRFREWGYTLGAIVSLAHDVVITMGLFSLLHGFLPFSMEIDQSFIAAILTVLGYSINDTVINYDRIRENVGLYPKRDRVGIINDSVNQMLGRTFSTTFTVIITLLAMFILGGDSIRGFVFAMLFGIFIGTYSSVFIASPITVEMDKLVKRRKATKAE